MNTKIWTLSFSAIIAMFLSFSLATYAKVQSETADQMQKDGQIIEDIITIDKNEIAAANLVIKKDASHPIKKYAQYLRNAHTSNLNQIQILSHKIEIKAEESDTSKSLAADGKKLGDDLQNLAGKDFDKAYVEGMINGHKAALQLIDQELLPNVTNKELKKQVESFRIAVNEHLLKGIKLQNDMK